MIKSGALIIDKHPHVTSHEVVERVRRLYQQREVGHAGTLDPLATGVLVCLLGDATKLSQYVMSQDKTYEVGILLGVKTNTGDITGETTFQKAVPSITSEELNLKVQELTGVLNLEVPKYSAVKVEGKKLYEYARKDVEVIVPVKAMVIHKVEVLAIDLPRLSVLIHCEKGTYVRSWVEKLGENLGCGATVESLKRTASGHFKIQDAINLDKLEALDDQSRKTRLIPMAQALYDWAQLRVADRDLNLVMNGQVPKSVYSQMLSASFINKPTDKGVCLIDESNNLVALAVRDPIKGVKLARVFKVC
ncbi:MAG: tRNA pseudouridine(55) synthase TruB [Oligoflexia bacterium]|nr:tRNA pseudouridine(55) synthase TruB [Oligoflexia bacterium]